MNNLIVLYSTIGYPKVRLNSISQVFTFKYTRYDSEGLKLRGLTLDDSFRYIPEGDIYVKQSLRLYSNYQLAVL